MRYRLFAFLLLVGSTAFAIDTTIVQPRVLPKVSLFPLQAVRVLNGPFRHIENLNHQYLLQLQPDRLVSWFRREAGLTPKAPPYPSWESEPVSSVGALPGHIMGFYLSAMSMLYASTGDEAVKEKLRYTVDELYECQQANGNGYLLPTINGKHVFEDVAAGNFTTKNPTINDVFEPTYVMNKIMLGLYEVYMQCGITRAKEIDQRMADWFGTAVLDKLDHAQVQKLLFCEHGSLNESFVQVYQLTGDEKYLGWAKRLTDEMMFTPLSENKEGVLNGQHANTQIPKFTGYENVYAFTGEAAYTNAAYNFWKAVALTKSWAIGGNSMHEHFFPSNEFEQKVNETGGPESCNSVNMMRLTEKLYEDRPEAVMVDYYERVLFNHILANYNPENGQCVYYTTMRPGGYKVYGVPNLTFWCCSGTGLEAPAKFGRMIFAHDDTRLFVNLFIPATVNCPDKGLTLTQQTAFPDENNTTLTVNTSGSVEVPVLIRKPTWLSGTMVVTVNGKGVKDDKAMAGYFSVRRKWKNGDVIRVTLPMQLKAEALPHSTAYYAFRYGPVVMASKVDNHGLTKADFNQQRTTVATRVIATSEAPALTGNIAAIEAGFAQMKGGMPQFVNAVQKISLEPFNSIHFNRYAVYFRRFDNEAAYRADKEAVVAAAKLENVEAQTVDGVKIGDSASEQSHRLEGVFTNKGGGNEGWRDANKGGYFMYSLRLPKTGASKLYIVFHAGDEGDRVFDVLVDGRLLQSFDHRKKMTGKSGLYPVVIDLPTAYTNNKDAITVKFAARNRSTAGGIFDLRILQ